MKHVIALLIVSSVLGGCSSTSSEWLLGKRDCGYIGCSSGTLEFYPNERFAAQIQPRRICGFEWGQTSSAFHPNSKEYKELRQKEIARWKAEGIMDLCYR